MSRLSLFAFFVLIAACVASAFITFTTDDCEQLELKVRTYRHCMSSPDCALSGEEYHTMIEAIKRHRQRCQK